MICFGNLNMFFFDESTNYLDYDCIDFFVDVINKYKGGLVFVSYDFRLIDKVVKEIWVCENKKVFVWKDFICLYKKMLEKASIK